MNIRPLGARAIVQFKKVESKKGALILPNEEQPQFATVIDVGYNDEIGLDIGELVVLSKYAGVPVKIEDEIFLIVEMKDIIAYVENE